MHNNTLFVECVILSKHFSAEQKGNKHTGHNQIVTIFANVLKNMISKNEKKKKNPIGARTQERDSIQHCELKAVSLFLPDIIWLQNAKCNWMPQFGRCRITHPKYACFLFASSDLQHYSACHSLHGCDDHNRQNKGQIYSNWINSRR